MHFILQPILVNELLVLLGEESPPLPDLQDEEVDQVDHHHHQGHQQEALGAQDRQATAAGTMGPSRGAATNAEGHGSAEHILETRKIEAL